MNVSGFDLKYWNALLAISLAIWFLISIPFKNKWARLGVKSLNKNVLQRSSHVSAAPIVSLKAKFKQANEKNGC